MNLGYIPQGFQWLITNRAVQLHADISKIKGILFTAYQALDIYFISARIFSRDPAKCICCESDGNEYQIIKIKYYLMTLM